MVQLYYVLFSFKAVYLIYSYYCRSFVFANISFSSFVVAFVHFEQFFFFFPLIYFFLCALVCYTSPTPKKGNKNLFWLPLSRRLYVSMSVCVCFTLFLCVFFFACVFLPLNQIFCAHLCFLFFLDSCCFHEEKKKKEIKQWNN